MVRVSNKYIALYIALKATFIIITFIAKYKKVKTKNDKGLFSLKTSLLSLQL